MPISFKVFHFYFYASRNISNVCFLISNRPKHELVINHLILDVSQIGNDSERNFTLMQGRIASDNVRQLLVYCTVFHTTLIILILGAKNIVLRYENEFEVSIGQKCS